MNRTTVAALAALEALIVVAIGLGIALVPATVLWAVQFHLAVDWSVFYRAAADVWLLGHGVDLTVRPDDEVAAQLGLGQVTPFRLTIAALGFCLLAVLGGARVGRRAEATGYRLTGVIAAVVAYGVLASAVTLTASSAPLGVSVWQGAAIPAAVFGAGVLVGAFALRSDPFARFAPATRAIAGAALRAGASAVSLVVGAAAVLVAVLLAVHFGRIVGLYESLQAGALGATVLTVAQLALLPNSVVWAASWIVGPGFAVGTGTSVSPLAVETGPLPSLPLLGILPASAPAFGLAALLIPLGAAVASGVLVRIRSRPLDVHGVGWVLVALGAGVTAGVVLGVLAWWSAGAIGPGRLQDAGPNPWLVGAAAALEVAVGTALGLAAARPRD